MDSKKLTLILFGSLAANVFLGGVVSATIFGDDDPQTVTAEDHANKKTKKAKQKSKAKKANQKAKSAAHDSRKHKADHRPPHARAKGEPHGSRDLMLLRHMVKIMGGPDDPRIKELREKKKDDIMAMRSEMKTAHDRVYQALTAETPDNAELGESLKALRKKTFEAQARAQEGIVQLHSLMTPKERASLREIKVPEPPERMRRKKADAPEPGAKTPPPPPGE